MNKKDFLIHQKIRLDRGVAWLSWLKNMIYIGAGVSAISWFWKQEIDLWLVALISFAFIIVAWLGGHLDYKKGIMLREHEIVTREYNPYFKKLEKKMRR